MPHFAQTYFSYFSVAPAQIFTPPPTGLDCVICIPCFCEPAIIDTLQSIQQTIAEHNVVEIIVAVNFSETASDEEKAYNRETFKTLQKFSTEFNTYNCSLYPLLIENVPRKQAGVGYARKIAMDEAIYRFAHNNNPQGIILCCDADCLVAPNYVSEVISYFLKNPTCGVATVRFEHPLSGNLPQQNYDAIAQYELHLRYYVEALRAIDFPYAYHTVGSSCAVRAQAYCRQGGMNKRQAGEDFYFLQKLFQAEQVGEINATAVYPSARISLRVPFGTGFAMKTMLNEGENQQYYTYTPESFAVLQQFFATFPHLFASQTYESVYATFHTSLQEFMPYKMFEQKCNEANNNASSQQQFVKRMFLWFNGFQVFKYLNYVHQRYFEKIPAKRAAQLFLNKPNMPVMELLLYFRNIQSVAIPCTKL
jgi:hypothetical protein